MPVRVTSVPPDSGPVDGEMAVMVGGGARYSYLPAKLRVLLTPAGVVTVMLMPPPSEAGAVAVIDVALLTVKAVAGTEPKLTAVAPVKFSPDNSTWFPPSTGPLSGETILTAGSPGVAR